MSEAKEKVECVGYLCVDSDGYCTFVNEVNEIHEAASHLIPGYRVITIKAMVTPPDDEEVDIDVSDTVAAPIEATATG